MLRPEKLWEWLAAQVSPLGLEVYDIDLPGQGGPGARATLRLFVQRSDGQSVTVSDCTAVSKRVINHIDVELFLPGNTVLEVSSPGINRKLRLPRHFTGAVGERVSLKLLPQGEGKARFVRGELRGATEETASVLNEENGELESVPLTSVADARVDYPFDRKEGEKWSAKAVSN